MAWLFQKHGLQFFVEVALCFRLKLILHSRHKGNKI